MKEVTTLWEQVGDALTSAWLPAWIQAVFSVVAILGAAWIARHQHNLERAEADRQQRKQTESRLQAVHSAVCTIIGRTRSNIKAWESSNTQAEARAGLKTLSHEMSLYVRLLSGFNLDGITHVTFWSAWFGLIEHLNFTAMFCDAVTDSHQNKHLDVDKVSKELVLSLETLLRVGEVADRAIKASIDWGEKNGRGTAPQDAARSAQRRDGQSGQNGEGPA